MNRPPYNLDYAAISASAIKKAIIRRHHGIDDCELSMLHMHAEMVRPRDDKGTPAMQWGTLCHAAVMEPEKLAVWTGEAKRGNEWKAFEAEHSASGRIVTTATKNARVMMVRDAVMMNSRAASIVRSTDHETPIQWIDPELGSCKAKPDMHALGTGAIVCDLKMLRDCGPSAIDAAIWRAGTDIQLAWYRRAIRAIGGVGMHVRCCVIAVESAQPHACTVVDIPPQYIDAAEEFAVAIAKRYRVHELCGSFPGPTSGEMTYEPPKYGQAADVPDMSGIESDDL